MRCVAALVASSIALVGVLDAAAADRPITQADSGKTFRVKRGGEMTLRLSNRWHWTTPRLSSKGIEFTPVEYFVDPGFREWLIEGRTRGTVTIRSYGEPNCTDCTRTARSVRIVIVVGTS